MPVVVFALLLAGFLRLSLFFSLTDRLLKVCGGLLVLILVVVVTVIVAGVAFVVSHDCLFFSEQLA